ncbi:MAG: alcohol dehydrogenase catalytic domain-containing protein [Bacillota bacterium]
MKAAVITGPGSLEVVEKPTPKPGYREVLIKVKYCGICGSDLHAYDTGFLPVDLTIGHEFSGIIAETGPGCNDLTPGDRVTGNNLISCGKCPDCLRGKANYCREMLRLGITGQGAMAEYILMPAEEVFKLPGHLPLEHAALAEPLSVGLHAFSKAGPEQVNNVLIIGAGTIGLVMVALMRYFAASNIIVIEPKPERLAVAESLGANFLINPEEENSQQKIDQITGKVGAELVFECAGLPATIQEACSLAGKGSQVVVLGICYEPVEVNFLSLITREINVKPAFGKMHAEFKEAVRLIGEGKLDLLPLISGVIPFSSVTEGFISSSRDKIKILVAINGSS